VGDDTDGTTGTAGTSVGVPTAGGLPDDPERAGEGTDGMGAARGMKARPRETAPEGVDGVGVARVNDTTGVDLTGASADRVGVAPFDDEPVEVGGGAGEARDDVAGAEDVESREEADRGGLARWADGPATAGGALVGLVAAGRLNACAAESHTRHSQPPPVATASSRSARTGRVCLALVPEAVSAP